MAQGKDIPEDAVDLQLHTGDDKGRDPDGSRSKFELLLSENLDTLTDPVVFFDNEVKKLMQEAAFISLGRDNVDEESLYLEVPGQLDCGQLVEIFKSRSIPVPVFAKRDVKARWLENKIAVKLAVHYRGWIVVAKPAGESDPFADGEEYFFNAGKILHEVMRDDRFKGKRFWQVESILKKEHGEESEVFGQIVRVRGLIQNLLYDLELNAGERLVLAKELIALKMEIGAAVVAVVEDFIIDFAKGDGWVDAVDERHNVVVVMDSENIRRKILESRLNVGHIDLRDLII